MLIRRLPRTPSSTPRSLAATATIVRAFAAAGGLGLALGACGSGGGGLERVGEQGDGITPISGCDYSFARPSPSSLASMGYKFAARYLSGDPGGGKDLTSAEATSLKSAGLDIVLVWETSGMDATSGYNQGVSDAQGAKTEAAAVGEPATRPIYFAIDFDATSGDASSINAYFKGVASVLGLSRTGVYGGYYIVDELFNAGLVTFAWQTYAWSGGAWDARAQLRQTQNGVDDDELDDDLGMVADFGQWGPNAPTGAAEYAAAYVSQSFPLASTALAMTEGQTIPSYIELKNVGTKTWDSSTHLGTTQPRDRASVFADATWLAADRPAGVVGTVAPGATYKFKFDLHAPEAKGTYEEFFGVVQEGVVWFSDPSQGGPADNDLEVKITVSAPPDAGVVPAEDAGAGVVIDASVGAEDASAATEDASAATEDARVDDASATRDAGHHVDSGKKDSGRTAEADASKEDDGTPPALGANGGCSVGLRPTSEGRPLGTVGWLGLLAAACLERRRRRTARGDTQDLRGRGPQR